MLESVFHHGRPMLPLDGEMLRAAYLDYSQKVFAKCIPLRGKADILDYQIAVCGIPGTQEYAPLELSTSAGYPWKEKKPIGADGKRWLFEIDYDPNPDLKSVNCELVQVMEVKDKLRRKGIVPITYFVDTLKDELLPKEKVCVPGKTRIFSMAPVDFSIQMRQCTMDFVAAFMRNRMKLEHAIGINADSREWTTLYTKLKTNAKDFLAADFSKFGDRLPSEIFPYIARMISDWYALFGCEDPELHLILKCMFEELSFCKHIMFDCVYQTVCGQPSGNPLTVVINSIAVSLLFRMAWLEIMAGTAYSGLDYFKEKVVLFSYGDDLIATVKVDVLDRFNLVSLQEWFAKFGMAFTDAQKSDTISPTVAESEVTFLKRGFIPHPLPAYKACLLAPLDKLSIEECCLWMNRGHDRVWMSQIVAEQTCRMAFTHGPEYYDYVCEKVVACMRCENVDFSLPTWEDLNQRIFNHGEMVMKPLSWIT